jgi:hypothetical protein
VFEYARFVARSRRGRGDPRKIRIAQAGGVATGFASGTRRGLTRVEAVAEIRERTTDPTELSEAAGETYFRGTPWDQDPALQRIDAVTRDILVDAGARPELIERYVKVRREHPATYRYRWWLD